MTFPQIFGGFCLSCRKLEITFLQKVKLICCGQMLHFLFLFLKVKICRITWCQIIWMRGSTIMNRGQEMEHRERKWEGLKFWYLFTFCRWLSLARGNRSLDQSVCLAHGWDTLEEPQDFWSNPLSGCRGEVCWCSSCLQGFWWWEESLCWRGSCQVNIAGEKINIFCFLRWQHRQVAKTHFFWKTYLSALSFPAADNHVVQCCCCWGQRGHRWSDKSLLHSTSQNPLNWWSPNELEFHTMDMFCCWSREKPWEELWEKKTVLSCNV